jgi:cytochrome oxidase Cu insertion factor (SCO1/SenC/PrrC family)
MRDRRTAVLVAPTRVPQIRHEHDVCSSAVAQLRGMLEPRDKAPPFTLSNRSGQTVNRSDFKGRKVLVYFYPD